MPDKPVGRRRCSAGLDGDSDIVDEAAVVVVPSRKKPRMRRKPACSHTGIEDLVDGDPAASSRDPPLALEGASRDQPLALEDASEVPMLRRS